MMAVLNADARDDGGQQRWQRRQRQQRQCLQCSGVPPPPRWRREPGQRVLETSTGHVRP